MNRRVFLFCFVATLMLSTTAFSQSFLGQYKGSPYHDTRYSGGPQQIPGKVLCAYYDLGGEGVAYHDTDPKNHGSGELNPADGNYLNEFRIHEGVDTSYTKFNQKPDPIDDNPFDKIVPPPDLPYVGWTEPGEWFNITVDVARSGTYAADFLYTSNRGGTISVDVNGKDATGPLEITTTNDTKDPLAWRQWHHWNLAPQLFKVRLDKGKNVLTVHIVTKGNMNLAYFDFKPADTDEAKRSIEAIIGVYRHSFANGDVQGDKFQSTNTLEIKRISDILIHVDVHLEFYNGHECNHEGIASYRRAGVFAEQVQDNQGKLCVFEVVRTATGVQLEDLTGMCKLSDCGMRGGYKGAAFSWKERVKVDSTVQEPTDVR